MPQTKARSEQINKSIGGADLIDELGFFDETANYNSGNVVMRGGKYYKVNTNITGGDEGDYSNAPDVSGDRDLTGDPSAYPSKIEGKIVTSDYTITEEDYELLVDASGGDVKITVPDQSTVTNRGVDRRIKRFDDSDNRVVVQVEVPNDSMFGPNYTATLLYSAGSGMNITLHTNDKYSFADWSGTVNMLPHPKVLTTSVSESGGTLSMEGNLLDLGAFDSMEVSFEYRDVTAGDTSRTSTTAKTQSTTGIFSDTATVTTGNKIKIRAKAVSGTTIIYGAEKQVNGPIYLTIDDAIADGMVMYLPMQEDTGTDAQADDVIDGNHATALNGVTIESDLIGGNTIYKRVFGTNDYLESSFSPLISSGDWTVGIQVGAFLSTGDHSIRHLGTNTLSRAGDGGGLQLSVNGDVDNSAGLLPTGGVNNYFTVVEGTDTNTYESTATSDTLINTLLDRPTSDATFVRIGRGASGDANQQDNEYLDAGEVRSFFIMNRALSSDERQAFSKCMDSGFLLIEGI